MAAESRDVGGGAGRVVLEVATSLTVAIAFVLACSNIKVDASQRVGQVSLLAAVSVRVLLFGFSIVGALVAAARLRGGAYVGRVVPFACSALAGLSSAVVAGGIVAILHGTSFGLGGDSGDIGLLAEWARKLNDHTLGNEPGLLIYPPMQIHVIAWISKLFACDPLYAAKYFQILGVLLLGPCSYGAWRLLLRPTWALAVGVVCSLPLIEAYRAYPLLVLMIFIPVMVKFISTFRRSFDRHWYELVRLGVVYGLGLGLMCLMYSGWFQWSAPGVVIAGLWFMPWRCRPSHAIILVGVTALVFAIVTFHYLTNVLHAGAVQDSYMYFDTTVEPAYVAMWRNGLPGNVTSWPPPGELGGVGLFTVLLVAGTGVSIWLGHKRTLVVSVSLMLAGAWFWRMWIAHHMYETKLVQLYPRTSAELVYGAMILTGYAVHLGVERLRPRASPSAVIGLAVALVVLFLSTGSATTDRYSPVNDALDMGFLAWEALHRPPLEGDQATDAKLSSSDPAPVAEAEGWIEVRLPTVRLFQSVRLTPASDGFPADFELEVWTGTAWVARAHYTNQAVPGGPISLRWESPDTTNGFRLHATKLRAVGDAYAVRMKKIELLR
jgi:hypothetical protein